MTQAFQHRLAPRNQHIFSQQGYTSFSDLEYRFIPELQTSIEKLSQGRCVIKYNCTTVNPYAAEMELP